MNVPAKSDVLTVNALARTSAAWMGAPLATLPTYVAKPEPVVRRKSVA
jgi:hypothetical protein